MKGDNQIRKRNSLLYLSLFLFLFSFSCGLSDIWDINSVSVKTHPKVVVPIAYGTIDMKTLVGYLTSSDSALPPVDVNYYSFDQVFTEFSIPDTFAFDGTLFNQLTDVELRIETFNHLPMGIDLELNFVDTVTFSRYGNPVECNFLKPAVIDKDGRAVATTHFIQTTAIPESQFALYRKATGIIMMVHLYTPQSENETIYLYDDDFLSLNIGLAIQITTGT
jgi:hypothetical protein